jgi:hypothetical protein
MRREPVLRSIGLLVLSALAFSTLALDDEILDGLVEEDGPVEWIGALALIAAAGLYLGVFRLYGKSRDPQVRRWPLIVVVVLLILAAGEELSWGQRVVGLKTPESLVEVNAQDELNIHNVDSLKSLLAFRIFAIFCLVLYVMVPLIATVRNPLAGRVQRLLPIAPIWLAVVFAAVLVVPSLVRDVIDSARLDTPQTPANRGIGEIREAILELLIGIAAVCAYLDARARRT